MAKTRQQKEQNVKDLVDKLNRAKIVLFTSFARLGAKGANVKTMSQIKRKLREMNAEYVAVKKTLLDLALKQTDLKDKIDVKNLEGSLGVLFGYEDVLEPNKSFYGEIKGMDAFKIYGAFWPAEGGSAYGGERLKFLDAVKIIELAKLPSREVLIAQLIGAIKSPIMLLRNVLEARSKKIT